MVGVVADRDLMPSGNLDLNLELFLFDIEKGFVQITTNPVSASLSSSPAS